MTEEIPKKRLKLTTVTKQVITIESESESESESGMEGKPIDVEVPLVDYPPSPDAQDFLDWLDAMDKEDRARRSPRLDSIDSASDSEADESEEDSYIKNPPTQSVDETYNDSDDSTELYEKLQEKQREDYKKQCHQYQEDAAKRRIASRSSTPSHRDAGITAMGADIRKYMSKK